MRLGIPINFIGVLSMAVDSGNHQNITTADVKNHIEQGDLIPFLKHELISTTTMLDTYSEEDAEALNQCLHDLLLVYWGREDRKFGIENSGLCLLISWTNEVVYRNVDPDVTVNIP